MRLATPREPWRPPSISNHQAKALAYLRNKAAASIRDFPEPIGAVTLKTLAERGMVTMIISPTEIGEEALKAYMKRHPSWRANL